MALTRLKVPAIIVAGVIGFGVGVGAGVLTLLGLGFARPAALAEDVPAADGQPGPRGGPGGMPGGRPGGRGGGGPGMGFMGGFGRGPNSKNQLATLVAKLDQLTGKPLAVRLDAAQRKQVEQQLKGLDDAKELSEEDAKKRLDTLLDLLKDQKDTFEAAGYRWPGQRGGGGGGFRPPADVPNPFKEEANSKHLQSLRQQLAHEKTE